MCVLRSVLVSVGFGRLLHGAVVLCRHLRTPGLSLFEKRHACPRSISLLLSRCHSRMYDSLVLSNWCVDVCVVGKIRNFKQ
jgi:hypothetical protein